LPGLFLAARKALFGGKKGLFLAAFLPALACFVDILSLSAG